MNKKEEISLRTHRTHRTHDTHRTHCTHDTHRTHCTHDSTPENKTSGEYGDEYVSTVREYGAKNTNQPEKPIHSTREYGEYSEYAHMHNDKNQQNGSAKQAQFEYDGEYATSNNRTHDRTHDRTHETNIPRVGDIISAPVDGQFLTGLTVLQVTPVGATAERYGVRYQLNGSQLALAQVEKQVQA